MTIFGVVVNPVTLAAIVSLVGGGIVSLLTQLIKNTLHLAGVGAVILTAVICLICTGGYFLIVAPPFIFGTFLVYSIAVFGIATGYYHFA
jgi:hypothetical protein